MIYVLVAILLLAIIFGPNIWVRYVLKKHHHHFLGMSGTGAELALYLIEQYQLEGAELIKGEEGEDFYRPSDNTVCLSPKVYEGKSLSAIAVAAHEVGRANQFNRQE